MVSQQNYAHYSWSRVFRDVTLGRWVSVSDVSQDVSVVIFKGGVQEEFCTKVGKHWPIDTAHTVDGFWNPQISHIYSALCDVIFNSVCVRPRNFVTCLWLFLATVINNSAMWINELINCFLLICWTHKAQNDLNNVHYINGTNQGWNCGSTFEGKVVVRLCVEEREKLEDIWKECDSIRQTE